MNARNVRALTKQKRGLASQFLRVSVSDLFCVCMYQCVFEFSFQADMDFSYSRLSMPFPFHRKRIVSSRHVTSLRAVRNSKYDCIKTRDFTVRFAQ